MLTIDDSVNEPVPAIVLTINSRFITGIARIDTRLVILLDLNLVLSVSGKQIALQMGANPA